MRIGQSFSDNVRRMLAVILLSTGMLFAGDVFWNNAAGGNWSNSGLISLENNVTGARVSRISNSGSALVTNLASGLYIYRIQAGRFSQVCKMILLK